MVVIVLTTGRSGSSLVAGLLVKHGCWTGPARPGNQWNPKGFFENTELKSLMIRHYGRDLLGPFPEPDEAFKPEVEALIKRQGYKSGHWLYKCGASYHKVWEPFDPLFIKVWRKPEDILASYDRCRFLQAWGEDGTRKIVTRQLHAMKDIPGMDIDADALVNGERGELKAILERLGLPYDEAMTNDFVDPKLWS